MDREENVDEFFDRVFFIKSGSRVTIKDKYTNAKQLLLPLNECTLEASKPLILDSLTGSVESCNPLCLNSTLQVAL